jgi:hypothetical protein
MVATLGYSCGATRSYSDQEGEPQILVWSAAVERHGRQKRARENLPEHNGENEIATLDTDRHDGGYPTLWVITTLLM